MENAFSRKGCKILETRLFNLKSNFTVTSTSQNHKKKHFLKLEADLHILMLSLSGLVS